MRKIKNNLIGFIASIITLLIPAIAGMILWNKLPETMALHFSFDGTPDAFYPKAFAVFGMYGIMLALHLFAVIATASEGKTDESKKKAIPDRIFALLMWIVPAVSVFLGVYVYGYALGYKFDISFGSLLMIGIICIVLGNYLPKVRQNQFVGARIKWTLESKKNWEHTNRFSAYLLMATGLIYILLGFIIKFSGMNALWMPVLIIVLLTVEIIAMIIYSHSYYVKHKDDEDYFK